MLKKLLLGLILAIALVHILATINAWYYSIWWLDIPMHIGGGIWVGLAYYYYFYSRRSAAVAGDAWLMAASVIGAVATVGIVWEFYEFFMDVFVLKTYTPFGYPGYIHFDTLKDLFNDLLGSTLSLLIIRCSKSSRR